MTTGQQQQPVVGGALIERLLQAQEALDVVKQEILNHFGNFSVKWDGVAKFQVEGYMLLLNRNGDNVTIAAQRPPPRRPLPAAEQTAEETMLATSAGQQVEDKLRHDAWTKELEWLAAEKAKLTEEKLRLAADREIN